MPDDASTVRSSPWLRPVPLAAFLTPIIAAPSGRGLVPILIILGGWSLWEAARAGMLFSVFKRPLALWVVCVTALAVISMSWAFMPQQSIKVAGEFFGLAVAGLALLAAAERADLVERSAARRALGSGLCIALIFLGIGFVFGHVTGKPLWGLPEQHPYRTLSHAQTVISVIAIPALVFLWAMGGRMRFVAAVLFAILITTFLQLEHGASDLALVAATTAYILVRIAGARSALLIGAAVAAAIILLPTIFHALLPDISTLDVLVKKEGALSELHRMYMWHFVLDNLNGQAFWIGHGADASRGFPGASAPIMWGIELMPLHPHNGALQAWLELGLAGALLVAVAPLMIGFSANRMAPADAALAVALLVAYLAPWMLSYGIWQAWWMAMAWLAAAIGRGVMSR